jgi:hypothetical protein
MLTRLRSSVTPLRGRDMQTLVFLTLFALVVAQAPPATAQSSQPAKSPTPASKPAQKSAEELQAIKQRVADWLKTCLADWDQSTHMTKQEWRTTCLRVSEERGRFLLENPTLDSLSKGPRRRN